MILLLLASVVDCGPPAAVAGVAAAALAHQLAVVPPWDGQFFDPPLPAVWPRSPEARP